MRLILTALAVVWCLILPARSAMSAELPNVVLILADDLGYGDVRANSPQSPIPTPNLDAVAALGMRFTDAHSPSAVCTPTRYGLLTGRYCWRTRLHRGVLNGYGRHLIEPGRPTAADLMKSHGYATACIGKWHLGMDFSRGGAGGREIDFAAPVEQGPITNGFDYFYGIPASLDFPPYVYVENDRVTAEVRSQAQASRYPAMWRAGEVADGFRHAEVLDHLADKSASYIHARRGQAEPFFLYVPLTSPHTPLLPSAAFSGRSGAGVYGDFVMQTDAAVGRIVDALTAAGFHDNTLLIVTSDNGSHMRKLGDEAADHTDRPAINGYRTGTHRSNGGWRGTKADIYEGGHRVYFAASWPGVIEPGSVAPEPVSLVDMYATLADLVDAPLKDHEAEDSFSLLPLLAGREAAFERGPLVVHSIDGMFAIRDGRWKLVAGNGSGGWQDPRGEPFGRPYQLFDLDADPGETNNLIHEHADQARRLETMLDRIRESGRSR